MGTIQSRYPTRALALTLVLALLLMLLVVTSADLPSPAASLGWFGGEESHCVPASSPACAGFAR